MLCCLVSGSEQRVAQTEGERLFDLGTECLSWLVDDEDVDRHVHVVVDLGRDGIVPADVPHVDIVERREEI